MPAPDRCGGTRVGGSGASQLQPQAPKVVVMFKAAGDAPVLKQTKYKARQGSLRCRHAFGGT